VSKGKTAYIDTIYSENIRPRTSYPLQLCRYLCRRFDIKKGSRLLDIGCGRGEFLNGFKGMGLEVVGIDREESEFHANDKLEVKYVDIEKKALPFGDNAIDIVFSKSVMEHLFNPENLMRECYRVLKPGGRVIVMTPDWVSQTKIFFDDYTHRQPYTVRAVEEMLNVFGFRQVKSELFYQLPIIWKYPILKLLSTLLRVFIPVSSYPKLKFIRWSIELMVLGTGVKPEGKYEK